MKITVKVKNQTLVQNNMVPTMKEGKEKAQPSKEELIDLIISGGLLEDFLQWIRNKGIEIDVGMSLRDIDYELIYWYAKEKNLIVEGEEQSELKIPYEFEEHEPRGIRPRTPPRRESK